MGWPLNYLASKDSEWAREHPVAFRLDTAWRWAVAAVLFVIQVVFALTVAIALVWAVVKIIQGEPPEY